MHKDIKLQNVFLTPAGTEDPTQSFDVTTLEASDLTFKIGDFGEVRRSAATTDRAGATGRRAGATWLYASPEFVADEPVGPPHDMFAVGMVSSRAALSLPVLCS